MTLRQAIEDDAATVFCNVDDFAEAVAYVPRYGPCRSINGVVFREQMSAVTQDGGATILPVWEIHVANSSTLGISSIELNLGGDQLEFPPRDGQTKQRKTITQLITQDHGMLVLECR